MTRELLEAYIYNIKKDIECAVNNKFHSRCHDLLNVLLLEDIPEILKFIEKVNKFLDGETKDVTGKYMNGYKDAINDIKNSIYTK